MSAQFLRSAKSASQPHGALPCACRFGAMLTPSASRRRGGLDSTSKPNAAAADADERRPRPGPFPRRRSSRSPDASRSALRSMRGRRSLRLLDQHLQRQRLVLGVDQNKKTGKNAPGSPDRDGRHLGGEEVDPPQPGDAGSGSASSTRFAAISRAFSRATLPRRSSVVFRPRNLNISCRRFQTRSTHATRPAGSMAA